MIIDDFKLLNGDWAKEGKKIDGIRRYTRAAIYFWNMMSRCKRGGSQQIKRPNYTGVVCKFADFNDFASWCQTQIGYNEFGFQLDKDILIKNNKEYSKETCVFVPKSLNTLLINRRLDRGDYPIGVCCEKGRFIAQCSVSKGRQEYLGSFDTPQQAFDAYKAFKESFIKQQAEKWKDQIDPRAYAALMNYQVEITD